MIKIIDLSDQSRSITSACCAAQARNSLAWLLASQDIVPTCNIFNGSPSYTYESDMRIGCRPQLYLSTDKDQHLHVGLNISLRIFGNQQIAQLTLDQGAQNPTTPVSGVFSGVPLGMCLFRPVPLGLVVRRAHN